MIGSFTFPVSDGQATATLEDDLTWSCTDGYYQKLLNQVFKFESRGPSQGAPGVKFFHDTVRQWWNHRAAAVQGTA